MNELEILLKASIEMESMRKAIKQKDAALLQAVQVMRAEYASLCRPSTTRGAAMGVVMGAAAKLWADAILAAENALKPVTVTEKKPPLPVLVCDACEQPTPGTIEGLCLRCDSLKSLLEDILPWDEEIGCEVIEIPRRVN